MASITSNVFEGDRQFGLQISERPGLALNDWRVDILVIDDSDADATLILKALKSRRDLGTVEARANPVATLKELAEGRLNPTVILLDLSMPRMSGFEFLVELRKIPTMAEVPVVFLTTSAFQRDAERARLSSACGYIVKPDSLDQLKTRLSGLEAMIESW